MVLLKSMTGRVVAPTSKGAHMPTQLEFTAKGWEEGRGERGDDEVIHVAIACEAKAADE